jgi:hypothetical protein
MMHWGTWSYLCSSLPASPLFLKGITLCSPYSVPLFPVCGHSLGSLLACMLLGPATHAFLPPCSSSMRACHHAVPHHAFPHPSAFQPPLLPPCHARAAAHDQRLFLPLRWSYCSCCLTAAHTLACCAILPFPVSLCLLASPHVFLLHMCCCASL